MEAVQYLQILRRWWWLMLASIVVGSAGAYIGSSQITPTYEASTTMLVSQQQTPGVIQRNDLETSALLASTYRGIITVRPLLERAIEQGGFDMSVGALRRSIEIVAPNGTQLLVVTAQSDDPDVARDLANVVATVFIESDELALTGTVGGVSIIEPAIRARAPVAPRKTVNAMMGGVLALFLGALLVLLFEYLDDTVRSSREVTNLVGLSTLGAVGDFGRTSSSTDQLRVALRPQSPLAESYRALRTNLTNALGRYGSDAGGSTVLFSGSSDDGKSTIVSNLAVAFGLAGYQVLAIDGDLRSPTLHRVFSLDNTDGLTNLLLPAAVSPVETVQQTMQPNVSVLTSGPIPSNPSELLGSHQMRLVLAELRLHYDLVLIDSPSAIGLTDASVLATIVDAVAIVVRTGRTRASELRMMVDQAATSGTPVIGVILNRARGRSTETRYSEPPERLAPATASFDPPNGGISATATSTDSRVARG